MWNWSTNPQNCLILHSNRSGVDVHSVGSSNLPSASQHIKLPTLLHPHIPHKCEETSTASGGTHIEFKIHMFTIKEHNFVGKVLARALLWFLRWRLVSHLAGALLLRVLKQHHWNFKYTLAECNCKTFFPIYFQKLLSFSFSYHAETQISGKHTPVCFSYLTCIPGPLSCFLNQNSQIQQEVEHWICNGKPPKRETNIWCCYSKTESKTTEITVLENDTTRSTSTSTDWPVWWIKAPAHKQGHSDGFGHTLSSFPHGTVSHRFR